MTTDGLYNTLTQLIASCAYTVWHIRLFLPFYGFLTYLIEDLLPDKIYK